MKTCPNCNCVFPTFVTQCLTCGEDLGEDEIRRKLAGCHSTKRLFEKHPKDTFQGGALRAIMRSLGGGEPNLEETEHRLRDDIRQQCELYYEDLAPRIQQKYDRHTLYRYIDTYLSHGFPRDRAMQLVQTLHRLAGLAEEFRMKLETEKRRRADEERQLRERAAEAEREAARRRMTSRRINPSDV
jgi:hypothetical protein